MSNPATNTVVVAIEQYDTNNITPENPTGLLSRREAIRYPSLPNALANQVNIMLSEGVDAGIIPEIEALRDQKAALLGEMDLIAISDPLLQARRIERVKEYGNKKVKEGKVPSGPK
jgi:methionine synthase I (cobalamin-dependent)